MLFYALQAFSQNLTLHAHTLALFAQPVQGGNVATLFCLAFCIKRMKMKRSGVVVVKPAAEVVTNPYR